MIVTMKNMIWVILLAAVAQAQKYKLCASVDMISDNSCYAIQRGDSEVSCLRVTDSAECAIRLAQGEADFGIFNAEELLLAYKFYPLDILPILQLRHQDKMSEEFEFQTVAVVRSDLTHMEISPGKNFDHLKDVGLCHPGFSQSQWWNDHILKYFEKTVVSRPHCQDGMTIIENEVKNLRDFFGKACRPGEWAAESTVDKELKAKYPELCSLCDNPKACTYNNNLHHGHFGALECLARNRGKVAYAALSYVQQYLKTNATFQFLCPNGAVLPLSSQTPCAWLKQPWSVIAANRNVADVLKPKLMGWLNKTYAAESWKVALSKVIQEDHRAVDMMEKMSMAAYLSKGREIDLANTETCNSRELRWCTIGDMETSKCKWVAKAAMAVGVEPRISCFKSDSTFQCLREIADKRADIIVIDSTYGYMARRVYGLSTVLYSETEMERNSVIIAVIREPRGDNFEIKSLHDLKGRKACFAEYSGMGWLSFVNVARTRGIISSKSCDYPLLVSKFFSGACTPGIKDRDHWHTPASAAISSKLCSACQNGNNTSCAANETNPYYGDKGAMQCLNDEAGDVAFVETANIIENIDPNSYRVLCKNGSLARDPGFDFDELCALSVTIDSEVVSRKNNPQTTTTDITLALLKMEEWLGYSVNSRRPIHIYDSFNGIRNLLFKDSTSGLVTKSSDKKSVLAYKELFSHIDECTNGAFTSTANFTFVALVAFYHILTGHVR